MIRVPGTKSCPCRPRPVLEEVAQPEREVAFGPSAHRRLDDKTPGVLIDDLGEGLIGGVDGATAGGTPPVFFGEGFAGGHSF